MLAEYLQQNRGPLFGMLNPHDRAVALLHAATHPKRSLEVTDVVLQQLNTLTLEDAAAAIQELHGPKRYI